MKLPKTVIMLSGMYEAPLILSHGAIIYSVMGVDNIAQVLFLEDSDKKLGRTRCHLPINWLTFQLATRRHA